MKDFPRKLNNAELNLLLLLLPESKPGYAKYREMINEFFVIGEGRFGNGNYFLGTKDDSVDLEISSSPILTSGKVITDKTTFDISINELSEGKIEFSVSPVPDEQEIYRVLNVVTLSDWVPGKKSPEGNKVELFSIDGMNYILCIAPVDKRIWLFEKSTGINYPVPVSNYYNELLRLTGEKRKEIHLSPDLLFENLKSYTESEIILAFLLYCKYKRRFIFDYLLENFISKPKNKKSLFNFFRRK